MQLQVLTIVTEAILEHSLAEDVETYGAHGYTVTEARGKGNKGVRAADWSNSSNIRMEIICTEDVCKKLIEHLKKTYYSDYAMISFYHSVNVIRDDKF